MSRTTKWRKKKRMREMMCNILAKTSFNNSSLSNPFEGLVEDDTRNRNVLIDNDEQAQSISTPAFGTPAFVEAEEPDLTNDGNDESFWLDEKSDEDDNVWTSDEMDCLFKTMCDNANPPSDSSSATIDPSKKEISAVMILLRIRHRMSIKSIDDLCKLMRVLKISNFPRNFASMNRLLTPESSTPSPINSFYICPTCCSTSGSSDHCENNKCKHFHAYSQKPFESMIIPITSQLQDVLSRLPEINLEHQNRKQGGLNSDTTMHDIYDGEVYQRIIHNERERFISFTMNIDGVQISKSSTNSLWIVTFAINEIKRTERFKMKNIIVGGILSVNVKPSHEHIRVFLEPIVKELIQLEKGGFFEIKNANINELLFFKAFLICCCADKPAQSLIQGLSEPIGAYGCGRCELQGITVVVREKSKKKIRVFPLLPVHQPQPRLRTNETYDEFAKIDEKERAKKKTELRDQMRGHVNVCVLRSLTYFDVGKSFLADSLHNIYHGVVKRLLTLWLEKKYRKRPWSISSKISTINQHLSSIKYPSTSTRIPRSITKYYQFKANELRAVCLYGFAAFCHVLPMKYARHFLMLVVAVHLSESRSIDRNQVENIRLLLDQFLRQFCDLYTNRHNTQSIHSLQHVACSIRDFGSLGNYSTFNFENILGLITSTIHSTRRHAQEINNNLNGLRMACIELDRSSFHMHLKRFIQMAQSSKRLVLPFFNNKINQVKFRHRDDQLNDLKIIQTALHQQDIRLYRSCHISTIRFTIVSYRINGQKSDGCILFTLAGKPAIGFVVNIIETERKQLLFRIRRISIKNKVYIAMNNKQIKCPNVIHGDLEGDGGFVYAKQDSIIEKLIYTYDAKFRCYIFFRVPNLCESS